MIDIHSHILPNLDDGSTSFEMTLDMLRNAEKDGTNDIIATPHFCIGYGEATYFKVKQEVINLRQVLKKNNININVYHGQEVYFHNNILEFLDKGLIGTINDSKYMLVELPLNKIEDNVLDILYEVNIRGIKVILAHPERYIEFISNHTKINKFIDEGILFQLNSGSILGKFGRDIQKTAKVFLKSSVYNFIGSDAHNNRNRTTGLSESIRLINKVTPSYERVFEESGKLVINNGDINFNGEKITKNKSFFFIKRFS